MMNTSSLSFDVNISTGPISSEITASKLTVVIFLLINFLFGLVVNALYLWVLRFRMKQSINNIWLFYLIVTNLVFILLLPFIAVHVLTEPHWVFGTFLCKVLHALISFCLFASVFHITGVSLNRYLLVCYPHWYIGHIRFHNASRVCFGLWVLAFICSSPYLLFRVAKLKDNVTVCYNDYSLSGKWEEEEARIKWGLFFFRILVSFLLPCVIIVVSHFKILFKIKRNQKISSTKPYKVIFLTTAAFFICWALYHVAYGMSLARGSYEDRTLLKLKLVTVCMYSCIGPICYLFVMENFTKELRKFMHVFAFSTS